MCCQENNPVAALSIDQDRVGFLVHVLEAFGFGLGLINWVKMIYTELTVSVLSYEQMSPFFQLSGGSKQRDPLLPLLFTLFLEPLAIAVRAEV